MAPLRIHRQCRRRQPSAFNDESPSGRRNDQRARVRVLLAEQGEDALRGLVGLREHARAGLLQDLSFVNLVISAAMSTSRMRDSDAVRFSW